MIRNANYFLTKYHEYSVKQGYSRLRDKICIDFSLKCDIIFIEIKNVETKDGCHDTISYQNTEII